MNNSSPRMALKLVDQPSPPALHAFCARCGAPPEQRAPGGAAWRESRVCAHCGLGLVLRSPLTVCNDSPLLVLDRSLLLSAMSRTAEALLGVTEAQAVGLPVRRLLVSTVEPEKFVALLQDAVLGGIAEHLRCGLSDEPERLFRVRVGPCGPPPGALLELEAASE